jgi:rhodanese-related sulfurtransferase
MEDESEYRIITPDEVASLSLESDVLVLDVRTPREYTQYHIPGSLLIPVQELAVRWRELDPERPTICVCEHGVRSETAAEFLAEQDFADVATMRGGLVRWAGPLNKCCSADKDLGAPETDDVRLAASGESRP